MPTYKLYYFNSRGFGELSRMMFALAGVDYEDIRYTKETWPEQKASGKFPFNALPCLEVDGTMLAQSAAIARYLANEFGFSGKTNLDKAKIDMIMDGLGDLMKTATKWWHGKDEQAKAEAKDEFVTKASPTINGGLEKLLIANNGGDGFFVGDGVTLADVSFLVFLGYCDDDTP